MMIDDCICEDCLAKNHCDILPYSNNCNEVRAMAEHDREVYNKAIDDYADKAIKIVYEANNRDRNPQPRDMVADIHYKFIELAKQLKAGGENISSNEWIPISERLPNPETYVLLSFENFSIPVIGRYGYDKDGGSFYAGDEDETLTSQDMYVNAWMPLPEPYRESESE